MASRPIEKITPSLELDENIELQQKGWMLQKILIVAVFLFILTSALGLFGNGILSQKKVEVNGNVLEYEKFTRYEGECKLMVDLADSDTAIEIAIPASYLDYFEIKTIVPEPYEYSMAANNMVLKFRAGAPNKVTLYLSARKTGSTQTVIKGNNTNFNISHFIYP